MGAQPWYYFVPYQPDISLALQELRLREFEAGRYYPATEFPGLFAPETPGPQHSSIDEAVSASLDNGTRSILDIQRIANELDYHAVSPLPNEELLRLYGTIKPTREQVEAMMDFYEMLDRGQGIFLITYKAGAPHEILFAGYSFD